jgi:chromosome segregation ATPase
MDLDPVKRPRLTPQPTSSANPEAEITHVSDSMPGTAPAMPLSTTLPLPQQLLETQTSLAQAQAALKANDKRHREVIASWEKRQYEYEDLVQRHRLLMGKFESATKTTETNAKHRELTTQRYEKRGAELEDLRKQLAEQKAVNATSDDEKIALITRLRDELAESKLKEDRATKRAESSEQTLEYTKEQYRLAQDSATDLAQQVATLNSAMPALQIQASGELTALKSLHLSKSYGVLKRKLEVAKVERENAAKILEKKDEEIAKLKSEKKSYGTRGGSVPRSPRVGAGASAGPPSRGASPLPGGRDRVANLRNG